MSKNLMRCHRNPRVDFEPHLCSIVVRMSGNGNKFRVNHAANESFYFAVVWAIAFTASIAVFLLLGRYDAFAFGCGVAIFVAVVILCRNASERRAFSPVWSYSRPNSVIICDIFVESTKLALLPMILDAAAKGVTLKKLIQDGIYGIPEWNFNRFIVITGVLLVGYWFAIYFVYSPHAKMERKREALIGVTALTEEAV